MQINISDQAVERIEIKFRAPYIPSPNPQLRSYPRYSGLPERQKELLKLKGNELKVLRFLKSRITTDRLTGQLTISDIQAQTGLTYEAIRSAMQQSFGKSMLEKVNQQKGAQGGSQFRIAADCFEFLAVQN